MKNCNFIILCDDEFHCDLMYLACFQAFCKHEIFIMLHYVPGESRKVYTFGGLWNKKCMTNSQ